MSNLTETEFTVVWNTFKMGLKCTGHPEPKRKNIPFNLRMAALCQLAERRNCSALLYQTQLTEWNHRHII